jgi:ribonuclease Z
MSLRVVFLGTGGSVPTHNRGLPAVLIQHKGEQILFDCGEGVQRQMIRVGGGFHRKMKIFITHMHGDHVLGLPGLMQTMALLDRQRRLDVYGPPGIREFLECVKRTVQFALTFQVEIHEIDEEGTVCEESQYTIEAAWSNHVVPSLAYAFVEKPRPGRFFPEKAKRVGIPEGPLWSRLQQGYEVKLSTGRTVKPREVIGPPRKGRKIVYTGDTRPFKGFVKLANGANILIHDATFEDGLRDRASEDGHSTPSQAARDAREANVKNLILTHISARYSDTSLLLKQAKKIFRKTQVAEDFMEMEIPFVEG